MDKVLVLIVIGLAGIAIAGLIGGVIVWLCLPTAGQALGLDLNPTLWESIMLSVVCATLFKSSASGESK